MAQHVVSIQNYPVFAVSLDYSDTADPSPQALEVS